MNWQKAWIIKHTFIDRRMFPVCGVTGRVLATFFRPVIFCLWETVRPKIFQLTSVEWQRRDYTFKATILTFLQSDTNYKKINILEMSVSLTFDTAGIDWRSKSIAQFVDALSVEEIIQMLHQMKPQDPTRSRLESLPIDSVSRLLMKFCSLPKARWKSSVSKWLTRCFTVLCWNLFLS